jgi:MFS transporter, AAHS family, 4-hydroxybenzoate transporter
MQRSLELRVAILCGLVVLLDGLDTQVIGYLGPALAKEWRIPAAELGPVFSAGLVGLMGGLLTLGPLADVWGRKRTILISVLLFGAFTLLTAQARGVTDLMLYRIAAGIGLGGAMPNALALTGEYSAPHRRATVTVAMFCGFSLGSVLGGGLSAALIAEHGWRFIFVIGGIVPLVLLPLLAWKLPESEQLLTQERVPVARLFDGAHRVGTPLLWVVFFMNLFEFFFLQSWMPTILTSSGMAQPQAILVTTLISVGGIVAGILSGPLMDRLGPYRVLAVLYAGGAVFVALVGAVSTSLPVVSAATFAAGFCVSGAQKSVNALAVLFYPPTIRSTGVGWALGIGRGGCWRWAGRQRIFFNWPHCLWSSPPSLCL